MDMDNAMIKTVLKECHKILVLNLNPTGLINHFWTLNYIDDVQRLQVCSKPTRADQTEEILEILSTRNNHVLTLLVEFVKQQENQSRLVTQLESAMSNYKDNEVRLATINDQPCNFVAQTNFLLNESHAVKITHIIMEDQVCLENWIMIKDLILTRALDKYEVGKENNIYQMILKTLQLWMSQNSGVTYEDFIQVLRKAPRTDAVAKMLEQKLEEVKNY